MRITQLVAGGSAALLGLCMLLSGGCSSNGQDRAQTTVAGLQDTRKEIGDVHTQVDKVLAAMNAMQGSNDLKTAFSKFSDEVDNTQSEAEDVKSKVQDMKDNSAVYIKKWQDEMSSITDPNLKSIANARQAAVQQRFSDIQGKYEAAKDAYKTFYGDLTSLRTYLSNDLTPDAVAAAKPSFDKANADGATLHAKGKDVTDGLDAIMTALPGGAANAGNQQ
jgi:ABC-type transporter Mla subunit MlaD